MTPLGCPDCLLIRYEHRALRARLHGYATIAPSFPGARLGVARFFGFFRVVCFFFVPLFLLLFLSFLQRFDTCTRARTACKFVIPRALNQRHRGYEILDAVAISFSDVALVIAHAAEGLL